MPDVLHGSAEFSACGLYRSRLDRWWADGPRAVVCGANPSKAGAVEMDPTMHRVVALLRPAWPGYTMVNASTYIATDPRDHERWRQERMRDGYADYKRRQAENLIVIRSIAASAAVRIAAWGNLVARDPDLIAALSCDGRYPIMCWGITAAGAPLHPLARGKMHIPAGAPLIEWKV